MFQRHHQLTSLRTNTMVGFGVNMIYEKTTGQANPLKQLWRITPTPSKSDNFTVSRETIGLCSPVLTQAPPQLAPPSKSASSSPMPQSSPAVHTEPLFCTLRDRLDEVFKLETSAAGEEFACHDDHQQSP